VPWGHWTNWQEWWTKKKKKKKKRDKDTQTELWEDGHDYRPWKMLKEELYFLQ